MEVIETFEVEIVVGSWLYCVELSIEARKMLKECVKQKVFESCKIYCRARLCCGST